MKGISLAAVVAIPHPRWDERPVVVVRDLEAGKRAAFLCKSQGKS